MTLKSPLKMNKEDEEKFFNAMHLVKTELDWATQTYGPFHSTHEGYAVILEELDELWDDVRKHSGNDGKEAVQVAAMAIRFIMDCCMGEAEKR